MLMSSVLDTIESIASEAGYEGERQRENVNQNDTVIFYDLELDDNREQRVIVGELAERDNGHHIIAFISPIKPVDEGWFTGLSSQEMRVMLQLNSQFPGGHFCLWETGQGVYPDHEVLLAIRTTQILETMDTEDFTFEVQQVAELADRGEVKERKDEF